MSDWVYRRPYRRPPPALRWIPDFVAAPVTITPDTASLTLTTFAPTVSVGIPFPITVVLDTFNRANENPIANSTWGGQLFAGDANISLVSNQAKGAGSETGCDHGWLSQYGPDCEVYVEIVNVNSDNTVQVFARLTAIGGSFDGYSVRARGGGIDNLIILRWDDGAIGAGLGTFPQVISNGDWFGMRLTGSLIEVFYKDVSISSDWFKLGETTDSTYSAAGHLGLFTFSDGNILDNFGGGMFGPVVVTPGSASLILTGFAAALQLSLIPAATSLTLTTFAPSVLIGVVVTPASAALTTTTFAPSLQLSITPENESLVVSTFAPTLQVAITPASSSLALTTFVPSVTITVTVIPAAVSLTLTSFAVQLRETLTPNAAILLLTTFAPTITTTANVVITPATASLTLTRFAPVLREQLTPASSTLTLTTFAPEVEVSADRTVQPASASLTLQTFAPQLQITLTPTTAILSLSTSAPTLQVAIQPITAALILSTFAPTVEITADITLTPLPASLILTTFAPTVTAGAEVTTVTPAPATLTLTSYAPWLFLGLVPANRTFVVESENYEVVVGAGDYEFVDEYEDDEVLIS